MGFSAHQPALALHTHAQTYKYSPPHDPFIADLGLYRTPWARAGRRFIFQVSRRKPGAMWSRTGDSHRLPWAILPRPPPRPGQPVRRRIAQPALAQTPVRAHLAQASHRHGRAGTQALVRANRMMPRTALGPLARPCAIRSRPDLSQPWARATLGVCRAAATLREASRQPPPIT